MDYRNFFKIFSIGAIGYCTLEKIWRGYTHWSMAITGGFCFTLLNRLFSKIDNNTTTKKCICGGIVITATEFIAGVIFNLLLKLNVWDYSDKKFNIAGQICPFYTLLWCILCHPVTRLCHYINKSA